MLVSKSADIDFEKSRLVAALSAKERELDSERREGEQRRAELIEISTQLGVEQSKRSRLEREIIKSGGSIDNLDKADLDHKDLLITKLQRQVDEDQAVIHRLKERSPSTTRSGTPRLSPIAPSRSRQGSKSSEASLRMEIATLRQQIREPDDASELRKKVLMLQKQLSSQTAQSNADYLNVKRELDATIQNRNRLQQQLSQYNNSRQVSSSVGSDASSKASRIDQVELESLRKEVDTLTVVRRDKIKEIDALKAELFRERSNKQTAPCNHHHQISELKQTIANLQSEKQVLQQNVSKNTSTASRASEVRELKESVAELQSENKKLKQQLQSQKATQPSADVSELHKQIDQLEADKADISAELHCLIQEMGEKRRMTKIVAEKASEFANTKKALMEQFEADKAEIASLKEEICRLSIELEVESTARNTTSQLVAVYSHKVGELLRDATQAVTSAASNTNSAHFLEILNSHAPVFRQLETHSKELKPASVRFHPSSMSSVPGPTTPPNPHPR